MRQVLHDFIYDVKRQIGEVQAWFHGYLSRARDEQHIQMYICVQCYSPGRRCDGGTMQYNGASRSVGKATPKRTADGNCLREKATQGAIQLSRALASGKSRAQRRLTVIQMLKLKTRSPDYECMSHWISGSQVLQYLTQRHIDIVRIASSKRTP